MLLRLKKSGEVWYCKTEDIGNSRSTGLISKAKAEKEVFRFIGLYCNSVRMHSALGYAFPREFEWRLSQISLI